MRTFAALAAGLVLGACDLPRDPEGTTSAVEGGTLRVGVISSDGLPPEDRTAIERVAGALDAAVETERGGAHALVRRLAAGEVHLVAGDVPAGTPFLAHAAATAPFGTVMVAGEARDRVLLLRKGENRFLMRVDEALRAGR